MAKITLDHQLSAKLFERRAPSRGRAIINSRLSAQAGGGIAAGHGPEAAEHGCKPPCRIKSQLSTLRGRDDAGRPSVFVARFGITAVDPRPAEQALIAQLRAGGWLDSIGRKADARFAFASAAAF